MEHRSDGFYSPAREHLSPNKESPTKQSSNKKFTIQHSDIPYSLDQPFFAEQTLKKRMRIPLAEFMDRLDEAKQYLPVLKYLPSRVDEVEFKINDLKKLLLKDYMTYQQMKGYNDEFKADLVRLMEKHSEMTVKRVLEMVEGKVPYEFLKDLMRNKASLDNIKFMEKNMVKLSADVERMYDRVDLLEFLNKQTTSTFEGVTKADIDALMKHRQEGEDYSGRFAEVHAQLEKLMKKVRDWMDYEWMQLQKEKEARRELLKLMDRHRETQEVHTKVKVTDGDKLVTQLENSVKQLQKKHHEQEVLQKLTQKELADLHDKLVKHLEKNKDGKLEEMHSEFDKKFLNHQHQIQNLKDHFQAQINSLLDQLKKLDHSLNKKNYGQEIEQLFKRCARNENQLLEVQQDNQLLKALKTKKIENLETQLKHLEDYLQSKLTPKINQIELGFKDQMTQLQQRMTQLENNLESLKGPLLDEIRDLQQQNEGLMREFDRVQGTYRELVQDYAKTLETKLTSMVASPGKYLGELQSSDEIVRNSTVAMLNKANQEIDRLGMSGNFTQLMSNTSVLSLGTTTIDASQLKGYRCGGNQRHVRNYSGCATTLMNRQSLNIDSNTTYLNVGNKNKSMRVNGQTQENSPNTSQVNYRQVDDTQQQKENLKILFKKRTHSQTKSSYQKRRNNSSLEPQVITSSQRHNASSTLEVNLKQKFSGKRVSDVTPLLSNQADSNLSTLINNLTPQQQQLQSGRLNLSNRRKQVRSSFNQPTLTGLDSSIVGTIDEVTVTTPQILLNQIKSVAFEQAKTQTPTPQKVKPITLNKFKHIMKD